MKAPLVLGIALAFSASALTQTVIVDNRMGGYAYNSTYNRLYNLRNQVTFTGVVTGIQRVKPMSNMDTGVTLLVKNDDGGGTAVVELGPAWFVDRQIAKIKPKQRVTVVGSKVFVDGRGVILAKLVKAGSEVLALRRPAGRPYWDIAEPVVLGPDPNVFEITGVVTDYGIYGTGDNQYAGAVLQTPGGTVTITSLKATKRGALTLKLRVSGPGRLDILGRPAKGKRSISHRVTAKRAGALTVTITAKQVRRLVARGKRGTIKVSVTFTGTSGKPSTAGPRSVRVVGR